MIHQLLTYCIALVWLINGLICKVLQLVPRHQQIVAKIVGEDRSEVITITIGILEVLMVVWILSGIKPRLNAITQILIVAAMNSIELVLVPDLLLFGRLNLVVAIFFMCVVYYWGFVLYKRRPYAIIS